MKILLVHNHYGSAAPSGENIVFELERAMLERHGHEVACFERFSDSIRSQGAYGMIKGALVTPWNFSAARALRKKIAQFRPDVMHAHNTFPLLSPAVFSAAKGIARVLTLHNYRLFCAAGIPMRDGQICVDCLDRQSVMPALRNGCYRESRVATVPLATNIALQRSRGTWRNDVEAFIALTDFQKDTMIKAGLPMDLVQVKPNFYAGEPVVVPYDERPNRAVFVGRLSEEKGIQDLVSAWLIWGEEAPELRIVGDGPLLNSLVEQARKAKNITFRGQVSSGEAQEEISKARILVLPSRWFEGFPMVLREAFAFATPSLVSHYGPLPKLVLQGQGIVFQGGDIVDLGQKLRRLWADMPALSKMSLAAKKEFDARYTEGINIRILTDIYKGAILRAESKSGKIRK